MLYIKITCCGGDDAYGDDYEMMCDLFMHVVFASNCWGLSMGGDYCLFDADDAVRTSTIFSPRILSTIATSFVISYTSYCSSCHHKCTIYISASTP